MVNAQQWLDVNYPKEQRKDVIKLDISGGEWIGGGEFWEKTNWDELEGHLDLTDFPNLEKLNCFGNNLSNFTITNCPKLRKINCGFNQLTTLSVSNQLTLTELDCSNNSLTILQLINNPNLEILKCDDNKLTSLNFLNDLRAESLIYLDISHNNLIGDLAPFSRFVNCVSLILGRNPLIGSLEPLKNLEKLKQLVIQKTNLDKTWEYLPKVKEINLDVDAVYRYGNEGNQELTPYVEKKWVQGHTYNFQSWRKDQPSYRKLKQVFLKINPNLDIQTVIDQFDFFNVKTGEFQGDLNNLLFFFKINKEETLLLKKTIENLTKELKNYKEKIVNAYLSFCSEKKLLKELINVELKYQKAKEQKQPSRKLEKQLNKLKDELEEKIGEEQMEEVEIILTDCGNLVRTELELESKINCNKLIEDIRKEFGNLVINVQQGHVFVSSQIGNNVDFSFNKQITDGGSERKELINQIKEKDKLVGNGNILESHIIDKEEQIQQEQDNDKLRFLQEELQELKQLKNQQAQIQIPPKK